MVSVHSLKPHRGRSTDPAGAWLAKVQTIVRPAVGLWVWLISMAAAVGEPAAERVALVIGNNAYEHAVPLANPINDAAAVGRRLQQAGYEVIGVRDGDVRAMRRGLARFVERGAEAETAVFFFAGHGIQVDGRNYLLAVDAQLDHVADVAVETLPLEAVLAEMQRAGMKVKLVVLDGCREDPFSGTRPWLAEQGAAGLAEVGPGDLPPAALLVCSASPGQTVPDRPGRHSPFTEAWLEQLRPGIPILEVVTRTAASLEGDRQPWFVSDGGGRSTLALSTLVLIPDPDDEGRMPGGPAVDVDDYARFAGAAAGERKLIEVAPGVEMAFRWCPPGEFIMGSSLREKAVMRAAGIEEPFLGREVQRRVTLTRGFWLAETPLTQGQWQAVKGTSLREHLRHAIQDDTAYHLNGRQQHWRDWAGVPRCRDPGTLIGVERAHYPMYYVNHWGAMEWCEAAGQHAGVSGWRMTLPTEAQWEYACRAGTQGMTYAGDFEILGRNNAPGLDEIAWYPGNSSVGYSGNQGRDTSGWTEMQHPGIRAGPREVGQKRANPWGLHDMIGNLWEWCADWYEEYGEAPVTDPEGPEAGGSRMRRGGAWASRPTSCRAAIRSRVEPGMRTDHLGFRPALVPDP